MKYILIIILISISAISLCYAQASDSSAPSKLQQELEKAIADSTDKPDSLYVPEKGVKIYSYSFDYPVLPEPINPVAPEYPPELIKTGIEGMVYLEADVYKDGTVGNIEVVKSLYRGPGGLDEAAVNAVKKWKFIPAKNGGKPVDTRVIIPIEFILPKINSSAPSKLLQELEKAIADSKNQQDSLNVQVEDDKCFSHLVGYVSPPEPINPIFPEYPAELRKNGIEGIVYLKVEVHIDGTVGEVKVIQTVDKRPGGLDEAAVNAVKKWRFIPGTCDGNPCGSSVLIPVEFFLSKDKPHQIYYTVKFESYESPPMVVKSVEPLYPDLHIEPIYGFVYLEVEVFISGQIGEIQIVKSLYGGPGGLDEAAIEAVRQWKFKPGLNKAGKEINTRIIVPVEFTSVTKRKTK